MQTIKDFFRNDKFAEFVGIRLVEVREGYAKATLDLEEKHLNGVRMAQGGAIFTLADLAFAAASNSHGTIAVAINANISFLKAATRGTLTAEAQEVSLHPRLGSYTVRVTSDAGELIALFQGMVYRKKDTIGPNGVIPAQEKG